MTVASQLGRNSERAHDRHDGRRAARGAPAIAHMTAMTVAVQLAKRQRSRARTQ